MGRKRKTNKFLPPRVYVHGRLFRYVPKSGPKITLGPVDDFGGMLRKYAELMAGDAPRGLDTLADVFDLYAREETPGKAAKTQRNERRQLANLRRAFGAFRPGQILKSDAYEYYRARKAAAPVAAKHEVELLRAVVNFAHDWDERNWPANALANMTKLEKTEPRRHYVDDSTYLAVWELAPTMIRATMDLAMLTGLRRGDILALTRDNMTDAGLLVRPSKTEDSTGVELLFEWSPALRDVLRRALAESPQVRRTILCNKQGRPFLDKTFDNAWSRLMKRATAAGLVRFQFKDLRKKSASDVSDAAEASTRLGHSTQAITDRVYRLKPKKVRPTK